MTLRSRTTTRHASSSYLPRRLSSGSAVIESLPALLAEIPGKRVWLCSDSVLDELGTVGTVADLIRLTGAEVGAFLGGEPEVSRPTIEACAREARLFGAEIVVGLGGGSNIDLAKTTALLVAYDSELSNYYGEYAVAGPTRPVVAIPTTSGSGSEVTPVAVVSDDAAPR